MRFCVLVRGIGEGELKEFRMKGMWGYKILSFLCHRLHMQSKLWQKEKEDKTSKRIPKNELASGAFR